jgi:hypothetical protein
MHVRIAGSTGANRPEHEEETLSRTDRAGKRKKDAFKKTIIMPT